MTEFQLKKIHNEHQYLSPVQNADKGTMNVFFRSFNILRRFLINGYAVNIVDNGLYLSTFKFRRILESTKNCMRKNIKLSHFRFKNALKHQFANPKTAVGIQSNFLNRDNNSRSNYILKTPGLFCFSNCYKKYFEV